MMMLMLTMLIKASRNTTLILFALALSLTGCSTEGPRRGDPTEVDAQARVGGDAAAMGADGQGQGLDGAAGPDSGAGDAASAPDAASDAGVPAADQAVPPPANARYVRAGAAGKQTGASWTDAFAKLPATLQRGATYFVASGSYPKYTFDDAPAGTKLITIRKATAADHGSGMGWKASYAQGQAVFGPLTFSTGYYVLDGGAAHGVKVVGGFKGLVIDAKGSQLTFRGCELDGNFKKSGGKQVDGACNGMNINGDHVRVERCDVHNIADDGIGIYGDDVTIRGSKIHALHGCGTDGGCGPCYNGHSDGLELQNNTKVALIGNVVYDIKSTAALYMGQWKAGNYVKDLTVINNIFYTPDTGLTVYLAYLKGAVVYNNVIWGRTQGNKYGGLAIGKEVTNLKLKNNIILNINYSHLGATFDAANHDIDHNLFAMVASSQYTLNANDKLGDPLFAAIPISSELSKHKTATLVPGDFKLTAGSPAIDTGLSLKGLVDDDHAGVKRPRDGDKDGAAAWDRGAFEL